MTISKTILIDCFISANVPEVDADVWIQGNLDGRVFKFDDGTEFPYYNWNTVLNQPNGGQPYIVLKKTTQYLW